MARSKKKESTLTPEEKLTQALVPDWEWPYKVPENWCWAKLKYISKHISDGSHNPPKDTGAGVPLLSATNVRDHSIDMDNIARWITEEEWEVENQRTQIEPNDVLLTIVATLGRTAVVKNEKFALQRSVAVIKPNINSEYLSYYFEAPYVQTFMVDNAKGTAQKGFYLSSLENLFCCVPPLAEQQRIVDRIESLFAKLDEAKEKAQTVLDSFENRKAAILHKAFAGELTANWRVEHGVDTESWTSTKVGEIVKLLSGQDFKPEAYNSDGDGIPYITGASNFDNNHVIINRWTSTPTVIAQYEDVLLVCKGSGFGKVIIADFEAAHIARQIMSLRVKPGINTYFIYYFLQSEYEYLRSNGQGLIPGISRSVVLNLPIDLPNNKEQTEIVRILDGLFAKEQQAKEAAEAVLEKIDLMKKSILARAFRGELGTNDPTEESAEELIKSILSEKIPEDKPKGKRAKKKPEVGFVAKTIMQALSAGVKTTPEKLKAETGLLIDDFYDQLKVLIDSGHVIETRIDGESYLEAKNEDRQPNN